MLTSMLTGLKGLVFKSGDSEKGQTSYTIILGKRLILPWMYKTATLYKNEGSDSRDLEIVIDNFDSGKYKGRLNKGEISKISPYELEELGKYIEQIPIEKKEYLMKNIENLPEKIRRVVYEVLNGPFFPNRDQNAIYSFEIQKVNQINSVKDEPKSKNNLESLSEKLSEKLYDKLYKKAI